MESKITFISPLLLKVLPPTIYMRVTENIPQIIAFIKQLVTSGHGYATSKGKFPNNTFAVNGVCEMFLHLIIINF